MTTDDRIGADSDLGPARAAHRPPEGAPTIRHVLAPLDGSTASEQAAPHAAAVSRRAPCHVLVLRPPAGDAAPAAAPMDPQPSPGA